MTENRALMASPDGPTNLRGGIRKLAKDVHILKPMLQSNNSDQIDNNKAYHINEQVFPTFRDDDFRSDSSSDWREIAHVLDRLFFWIVFLMMTTSTVVIITVPIWKTNKFNEKDS